MYISNIEVQWKKEEIVCLISNGNFINGKKTNNVGKMESPQNLSLLNFNQTVLEYYYYFYPIILKIKLL